MSIKHPDHEAIAYTLSRALLWSVIIALTAYIAISETRVVNLVPTPYVNVDEGEIYDE